MAKTVIRLWGHSEVEFQGMEREGARMLYEYGVNYIRPGALIDLHVHKKDSEDYIPLTEGIKIIVLTEEEAESMMMPDVLKLLMKAEPAEIGKVVKCPKGHAHALYSAVGEDCIGAFQYIKYYE